MGPDESAYCDAIEHTYFTTDLYSYVNSFDSSNKLSLWPANFAAFCYALRSTVSLALCSTIWATNF